MQGLPCKNPTCKGCGKPHPHCHCYADGGEIPSDQVILDSSSSQDIPVRAYPMGGEIPSDQVALDSSSSQDIPADQVKVDGDIPADQVVLDSEKYGGAIQQIKAGLEGAGQGFLGPIAPWLETKAGVNAQDIAGRQRAYPMTNEIGKVGGLAASFAVPFGQGAVLSNIAGHASQLFGASKTGAAALNLFLQGASFAGSDDITKSLLGQPGSDPEHPVATALLHMGGAGLITVAGGGLFNILGRGLDQIGSQKMVDGAEKLLARIGNNGDPVNTAGSFLYGVYKGATAEGDWEDKLKTGFFEYEKAKLLYAPLIAKALGAPATKINGYVTDAITSALLKNNPKGVGAAMQLGSDITQGAKKLLPAMQSLFKAGTSQVVPYATDELKNELKDNVEQGTPLTEIQEASQQNNQPQNYAQGGAVQPETTQQEDHFGSVFPEQNILFNEAKGRVYNYLNSIRPVSNQPKLPFDDSMKDSEKQRSYDKAVSIACNPLEILNHVKKGDLTPDHMKHFTSMYPEVHRLLSQKITEKIIKSQLDDEKPSYGKRQALSMFLGTTLDSSMTPQAIQAAQGVFAQKQMAQQAQSPAPKKKGKSSLTKTSQSYLTDDQARQQRQQKI